jgi:EAL and modified HD-GYP domain-containing signal transduction protein
MDGDTRPDNDVLGALLQLKSSGYAIALNNLVYGDEMRPIVERADIVKVNIRKLDRTAVSDQMKALKPFNTKLLAAEVETHEDYQFCKSLGFDYFEGYFFAKPQVSDQPIPSNRLSTLQLLSKLQDHEIGLAELEHVVGQDLAMSYRILRYLNSPMHALPRKIDSIRHAIALVGTGLIRQWASVIWLESIEDKPQELMNMALIRAHMCQQLANAMGAEGADQFFTVGLLSLLDALIDRPMVMVLEDLPLIEPVKDALLHRNGLMGAALNCAEAYERCEWERTSFADLNVQRIRDAYLNSIEWSRTALSELVN